VGAPAGAGKLVFVFPGQGSQWPGMARALLATAPVFRDQVEACARALARHVEWSLLEVLRGEPGAPALDRVDVVQPALFAVMVGLAALWRAMGIEPDAVVGHSQGEVAAACVAGALSLEDAAAVVALRSRAATRLAGHGAMAAVELGADALARHLAPFGARVAIAAINSPTATVVSGEPAAIDGLLAELGAAQIFARKVRVDYASHGAQVEAVRAEIVEALAGVAPRAAAIPIYSTVTGAPVAGQALDGEYWYRNLRHTVRFADTVDRLWADGHHRFVEVSPHPVLAIALTEVVERAVAAGAGLAQSARATVVGTLRREEDELKQGDAVFVPRWAIHQSQNLGDREMVILAITDYGLTGKAFMGNYYRASRGKEDLFQSYSIVDFIDREFWADPYPLLARARAEGPVYYSETFDAWFLTRYADIDAALRDDRLSSRRASFKFAGLPPDMRDKMRPFERSMGQWMIFNDPPDHTRLRSFSSKLFSPRFIASLRPSITRVVNELLDEIAGKGEADLMRDLGSPLPGIVVADMLGVTGSDRRKFEQWSDDIAAFAGASEAKRELAEAGLRSWRDMTACVKEVVEARRRHPEDDFLTSLLAVTSTGDQLTEEELLSSCIVLLAAGHGATQDTVCNSILTLLRNPEALAQVRADPGLLDATGMDELLRFESALQLASRVALDDLVIGGQQIRKGQRVMSMLGAANRDPEQFPEPDKLDLHRKVNRHTAFGVGAHYCIGGPLGRLEGIVTVNAVLARFPKLQLATDKLEWKTSISFRGVRSLPVRF
jgi:cytochrome P450